MLNMPAVMVSCGLCVGLMMVLIFSNSRNIRIAFYDDRLYFRMCFVTLFLSILDFFGFWLDGKEFPGAIGFNTIVNSALFFGNSYFTVIWFQYVLYKLKGKILKNTFRDVCMIAPPLIIMACAVVNLFVPVLFSIDSANVYHRMPLSLCSFILIYVYLIGTAVMVFRNASKLGGYIFMPILVFIIPVILGSVLQWLFYGISLIYVAEAFGLTSLYISIQNESSLLDSLTKLYNREFLTRYVKSFNQKSDSAALLGGIMVDINSFKDINDKYGHEEGDKALVAIAKVLKSSTSEGDLVARYGGDEFVILRPVDKPRDLEPLQENLVSELRKFNLMRGEDMYEISLSIGSGVMDPNVDSPDDFIRLIDSRMYKDKEDYYRHMGMLGDY